MKSLWQGAVWIDDTGVPTVMFPTIRCGHVPACRAALCRSNNPATARSMSSNPSLITLRQICNRKWIFVNPPWTGDTNLAFLQIFLANSMGYKERTHLHVLLSHNSPRFVYNPLQNKSLFILVVFTVFVVSLSPLLSLAVAVTLAKKLVPVELVTAVENLVLATAAYDNNVTSVERNYLYGCPCRAWRDTAVFVTHYIMEHGCQLKSRYFGLFAFTVIAFRWAIWLACFGKSLPCLARPVEALRSEGCIVPACEWFNCGHGFCSMLRPRVASLRLEILQLSSATLSNTMLLSLQPIFFSLFVTVWFSMI